MTWPENIRFGAQPIIWSNDDFHDLGGDISLETCLSEMKEAGYTGTEMGHKFPKDAATLKPLLEGHGLDLVSAWHSTYLLDGDEKEETERFDNHAKFLNEMGCSVVILAECSRQSYQGEFGHRALDLRTNLSLPEADVEVLAQKLDRLAVRAQDLGMHAVYHHHMGTVIQNLSEVRALLQHSSTLSLLLDTGHLAVAGVDPAAAVREFGPRIKHVHLKNVRLGRIDSLSQESASFETAVRAGIFTVPGDKDVANPGEGLDFGAVFAALGEFDYQGWLVVEAEQDPVIANPLEYAITARAYLREQLNR